MGLLAEWQERVGAIDVAARAAEESPGPGWWFGRLSQQWHPPIPGYSPHAPHPAGPVYFPKYEVVYIDDDEDLGVI